MLHQIQLDLQREYKAYDPWPQRINHLIRKIHMHSQIKNNNKTQDITKIKYVINTIFTRGSQTVHRF